MNLRPDRWRWFEGCALFYLFKREKGCSLFIRMVTIQKGMFFRLDCGQHLNKWCVRYMVKGYRKLLYGNYLWEYIKKLFQSPTFYKTIFLVLAQGDIFADFVFCSWWWNPETKLLPKTDQKGIQEKKLNCFKKKNPGKKKTDAKKIPFWGFYFLVTWRICKVLLAFMFKMVLCPLVEAFCWSILAERISVMDILLWRALFLVQNQDGVVKNWFILTTTCQIVDGFYDCQHEGYLTL